MKKEDILGGHIPQYQRSGKREVGRQDEDGKIAVMTGDRERGKLVDRTKMGRLLS
jgi:hypothetical protein